MLLLCDLSILFCLGERADFSPFSFEFKHSFVRRSALEEVILKKFIFR